MKAKKVITPEHDQQVHSLAKKLFNAARRERHLQGEHIWGHYARRKWNEQPSETQAVWYCVAACALGFTHTNDGRRI